MVLPTTATLDIFANPYGDTAAHLADAMTSEFAPVDQSDLINLSATATSDATSVVGGQARRRLVLDLTQPPIQFSRYNKPMQKASPTLKQACSIQVVSRSPRDSSPDGDGLKVITVHWNDTAGNPHSAAVAMNGTTPVTIPGVVDAWEILDTTVFTTLGASSSSQGVVTITLVPVLATPSVAVVGAAASFEEGFLCKNTVASLWNNLFTNLLTQVIQRAIGPCVAADPVLT